MEVQMGLGVCYGHKKDMSSKKVVLSYDNVAGSSDGRGIEYDGWRIKCDGREIRALMVGG